MAEYSIGIDLGGTNLRAAAIDRSGAMLGKIAGSTHLSAGREAVIADMVAAIHKLREQCGVSISALNARLQQLGYPSVRDVG